MRTIMVLSVSLALLSEHCRGEVGGPPPGLSILVEDASSFSKVRIAVKNEGRVELRLWKSSNSWGYRNLSICLLLKDGRIVQVCRKAEVFSRNIPSSSAVAAGKELAMPVDLGDGWWDIPKNTNLADVQYLSAVYAVEGTQESQKFGVWTGVAVSTWRSVPVPKAAPAADAAAQDGK
jgi:hypothetical protein